MFSYKQNTYVIEKIKHQAFINSNISQNQEDTCLFLNPDNSPNINHFSMKHIQFQPEITV